VAGPTGTWPLRALYVWTGLVATLTPIAFWLLLGEIYTIAQARRLYASIGLGSQLGAIAGALAAPLDGRLPGRSPPARGIGRGPSC
jgi:ATP/ADP translocase